MLKKALTILAMILTVPLLAAFEKPKTQPPKKAALTEEEKEILKNRDILENLELLRDFEKFRFLDFFTGDSEPEKGKEPKKPATQKDEKKAK